MPHFSLINSLIVAARALVVACVALGAGEAQAWSVKQGAKPGVFDFYVLALSWSPGFCALGGKARQSEQCAVGKSQNFVVHGLWPEYKRGSPRECTIIPGRTMAVVPSHHAMMIAADVFPEQGLARHQWRVHGTCSGKTPEGYFRETARARDKVVVPRAFQTLRTPRLASTVAVKRAFIAANPGLKANMIATACQDGRLKEVRICLTRDLSAFRACPQVARSGCRGRNVTIDAPQ